MKKRMIAFLLALMLAAGAVGCGGPTDDPSTESTPATTEGNGETVTQTTPDATGAATKPTEGTAEFPDVTRKVCIPLLEKIGNATLEDSGMVDEKTMYLGYANGSKADLDLFLTLCGYCGLYRIGGAQDDGSIVYYLTRPGSDLIAMASLMKTGKNLLLQIPMDCELLDAQQVQAQMDYYLQDLTLPTGYGPNVMPEFHASIGRTAADVDGLISNIFPGDKETCWFEMYYNVDYPTLHRYFSDMMLCGFDIKCENVKFGQGDKVSSVMFMLDNGSSKVAVSYDAESGDVTVYYEPGVNRYLLKGTEYAQYIPKP